MYENVSSIYYPDSNIGHMFWVGNSIWQEKSAKIFKRHKLPYAQYIILSYVIYCNAQKILPSQSTITQMSRLEKMLVSRSVKTLIEKGFVTQYRSKNDPRSKALSITKEGDEVAHKIQAELAKLDIKLLKKLNSDERNALFFHVEKLIGKLEGRL